ncbi:MAG: bifunctional glutamate N-acetyltransferase/amino-acid acetyltransferase ArgJ [Campylobacterales bacterium]|nr:bifunctional glutamate N-acetyltransferase/amino-acid acetyltransferase ArgJ [Campylobacterales bacterium]
MFKIFPIENSICAPKGFFSDGVNAGLKPEALDLCFVRSQEPCDTVAVFTSNRFQAAPIIDAKEKLKNKIGGILINSKNANAMTGQEGLDNIDKILKEFPFENCLMSSTGVIGQQLPVEKILEGIKKFDLNGKNSDNAAKAIMTTDAFKKEIALKVVTDKGEFRIGAMAKGAGMIAPSLATMLCFVTTDAKVEKAELQEQLETCLDGSFNAISVDGDMSTNDSIFIMANGKANGYEKEAFREALQQVLHHLALQIAKDGEGAKKLVAFDVKNAKSYEEAKKVAKNLSNSLLVKTALFGEDPNWGRIASTIGAAQVQCKEEDLKISIGSIVIYDGKGVMTSEVEEKAYKVLQNQEFKITCDLGTGSDSYTAYGCDLGYEYVKINAEYRT